MLQGMTQQFGGMGMGGQPANTPSPGALFGGMPPQQQPYGGGMATRGAPVAAPTNPFGAAPVQPAAAMGGGGMWQNNAFSSVAPPAAPQGQQQPMPAPASNNPFGGDLLG